LSRKKNDFVDHFGTFTPDSESNRHPADSEAGIRFSTAKIASGVTSNLDLKVEIVE
jgi:hypothetical protein